MIHKVMIRNFRGIKQADLELAPITVLTGANNAGKSTVMYGLLTLKNVVTNPNQPTDSFFNFGFVNLGGFKQAVFIKDESLEIGLGIETSNPEKRLVSRYGVSFGKHGGAFKLGLSQPFSLSLKLDVTFPYALNLNASGVCEYEQRPYQVTWNGLTPTVAASDGQPDPAIKDVTAFFTLPTEEVRRIDMVPLRRGFSKPVYAAAPVTPQLLTEDEVATVLASDSDLLGRVDRAVEPILNRNVVVFTPPGTASFYLQTRDRDTGTTTELVNDGFGTSQLVFMLAKTFKEGSELVCIEEPEIHLHPTAATKFVERIARTAKESIPILRRQFLFSTHSEHLVSALLSLVAKGQLSPQDLALYYVYRKDYETVLERSELMENGQVRGGLRGFYEAELGLVKDLLGEPKSE